MLHAYVSRQFSEIKKLVSPSTAADVFARTHIQKVGKGNQQCPLCLEGGRFFIRMNLNNADLTTCGIVCGNGCSIPKCDLAYYDGTGPEYYQAQLNLGAERESKRYSLDCNAGWLVHQMRHNLR